MELIDNICQENIDIIQEIYKKIYVNFSNKVVDVFLCGGSSSASIRNEIKSYLWNKKEIRLLYPEDLFIEMLNVNKKYNLLNLENFLANNCDIICIICESAGSLVELGAFTNNSKIINKIVAVVEKNNAKQQSFIMLGPIKLLKQKNPDNFVTYDKKNIKELSNTLAKKFSQNKCKKGIRTFSAQTKINTIIGLYYFIPILLYFFTLISSTDLAISLKQLLDQNKIDIKDFDATFKSALKLLKKERIIEQKVVNDKKVLVLLKKGYQITLDIFKSINLKKETLLRDKIRFAIMKKKYYHYLS